MKYFFFIIIFIFLNACSLNTNSKYWTEDPLKKMVKDQELIEILKKSEDIRSMTIIEYNIYVDDYANKSKYPSLIK
jgi:hypothetical protein